MKTNFKLLMVLPFFAFLMFSSCQDEVMEITEPNEEQTFEANSEVAELMSKVATFDGSKDNIIDGANELSLKLPVTVIANGEQIVVASEEDYNKIEANFDAFEDDDDSLEIVYPVTVTLRDHSDVDVNSRTELDALRDNSTDEEDDDIECIDFKYPISFSVYDSNFQVIDVITVENDTQLYRFIHNLEPGILVSLNFPVTMIYADGSTIEVNSYLQLGRVILEARHSCDEDDDNDYNDDDFTVERLNSLLVSCPWLVHDIRRSDNDLRDDYFEYIIVFNEDGTVKVRARNGNVFVGIWETSITDHGAKINLEFDNLFDFTLNWFVYEIEEGKIKLHTEGGNRIVLRKNCDVIVDHTIDRVENFLVECMWRIVRLRVEGADNEEEYIGTPLKFFNDNVVKIRVNGELVEGTWNVLEYGDSFVLQINLEGRPDLQLEWLITVLEPDVIKLESLGNPDNEMVLKRHCPDGDEDLNFINNILIQGEWEVAQYKEGGVDMTIDYLNYAIDFLENGGVLVEGHGQIIDGSWLTLRDDGYLKLALNFGLEQPFNEFNDRWKVISITETRLELLDISGGDGSEEILVLERIL